MTESWGEKQSKSKKETFTGTIFYGAESQLEHKSLSTQKNPTNKVRVSVIPNNFLATRAISM
jgi:hypothetical protein